MNEKDLLNIAQKKIKETFEKSGKFSKKTLSEGVKIVADTTKKLLKEALVIIPRGFILKTERLSPRAKEAHEGLYKEYVQIFNGTSSKLDTASKSADIQAYRALKTDEVCSLNAIKLHELYFSNISDVASEIRVDSLPFMRFQQQWGTFDNWQLEFRLACMASKEGWAITYYDPFKNVYMNCVVDGHTINMPVGCIPIIVMDMWSHSYYRDYLSDKKAYVNGMMQELNWNVIEARMVIAERANLHNLYLIQPIINSEPERLLSQAEAQSQPPIGKDQVITKQVQANNPETLPPPTGLQVGQATSLNGTGGVS